MALFEVMQVGQPHQHVEVQEHEAQVDAADAAVAQAQHEPTEGGERDVGRDQQQEMRLRKGRIGAQILQHGDDAQDREAGGAYRRNLDRVKATRAGRLALCEEARIERKAAVDVAHRCRWVHLNPSRSFPAAVMVFLFGGMNNASW